VLLADTAYDADRIIAAVRAHRRRLDRELYRQRYLVEVFFHNLKRFRAIATRYEKTATNYLALVHLACVCIWLA